MTCTVKEYELQQNVFHYHIYVQKSEGEMHM